MPIFGDLLDRIPASKDISISTEGYALWIVWGQSSTSLAGLDPFITKILQDYGALQIKETVSQSLWFFFSSDILLSLAKLDAWSKQRKEEIIFMAMPAKLNVTLMHEPYLTVKPSLHKESIELEGVPGGHSHIHNTLTAFAKHIPGITLKQETLHEDVEENNAWVKFSADPRLPYTSKQGWFAIIHPVGNPLDTGFHAGWENTFRHLEEIIKLHKFKYSINDNFLVLPIESLRALRTCLQEMIQIFYQIRESEAEYYWPCACVVADKRNLSYSDDLPKKIGLDWNSLRPDFPYLTYRNAFLIGENFSIQDVHLASSDTSIDNWCTIDLASNSSAEDGLTLLLSNQLVPTDKMCFYCASGAHSSALCPTRRLPFPGLDIWEKFADIDVQEVNEAFRNIDKIIEKKGTSGYQKIFEDEEIDARVLSSVFSINAFVQVPAIRRVWEMVGRDILQEPKEFRKGELAHDILLRFERGDVQSLNSLSREIDTKLAQNSRDWQLHCLLGFVSMELGEVEKAYESWQNAQSYSAVSVHQAWCTLLQARLFETTAKYVEAKSLYEKVGRLLSNWKEPEYRELVCDVKMGFGEVAAKKFAALVRDNPSNFNKIFLDPELDRGQRQILTNLNLLWDSAQRQATSDKQKLELLLEKLALWFPENHPTAQVFKGKINILLEKSKKENYLIFLEVSAEHSILNDLINVNIQTEIETLEEAFRICLSKLEYIRDEISWFSLQGMTKNFTNTFNEASQILNWAFSSDLRDPEIFRKAQERSVYIKDLIPSLEKNLRSISIIRDIVLFGLLSFKSLIIYGTIFFFIGFALLFALLFFGHHIGLIWLQNTIRTNFWNLQPVLFSIIVLISFGVATLKTTVSFDKKRAQMISIAKKQREASQQQRLQKAQHLRDIAVMRATVKLKDEEKRLREAGKQNA